MGFLAYCRQSLGDFMLVALAAISLSYVVLFAFNMSAGFVEGPVPGIVSAVFLVALFGISYDKRTLRVGIPAYLVVCVAFLAVCASLGGDVSFLSDEPGNLFIGGLVVVATTTLAYALSRRLSGCAVLFAAGAFACALVQFFYRGYLVVPSVIFMVAAVALMVFKNFQLAVRSATSVRAVSFGAGFVTSLAVVGIAAGMGALVWFAVIAPLNPGAFDVKLITEYRALETLKVVGVSDVYQTPNVDLTSDDTIDDERTTDQLILDENGKVLTSAPDSANSTNEEEAQGAFTGFTGLNVDSLQDLFDVQTYQQQDWIRLVLLIAIPLLVLLAYFIGRRIVRAQRLKRIQRLSPSAQVDELYRFLMARFSRIGLTIPAGSTISEFARANVAHMEPFVTEQGDDFVTLSDVYSGVSYGAQDATQEQADAFARYYRGFWRGARKRLGNMRYLVKSLRL